MGSQAAVTLESFPWDDLLDLIEDRLVIPVVGRELLVMGAAGSPTLESYCTSQLVEQLTLGPAGHEIRSLNQLAVALSAGRGRGEPGADLPGLVSGLRTALETVEIPSPLRDLATLPFPLLLTTTFDPLLSRALDAVRFGGKDGSTRVLAYYPGAGAQDLPCPLAELEGTTVFHLFGRLSAARRFAITDADVLECVLALQTLSQRDDHGGRRNLFEALSQSSLLLLGTGFSDWLARFFLRVAAQNTLSEPRRLHFVSDTALERDHGLVLFLRHFAAGTRTFLEGSPGEFVRLLSARWAERCRAHPSAPATTDLPPMEHGAVFLSYATEDRGAAETLRVALDEAGIDVWFDRSDLQPGDRWSSKICRNIQRAACFIALVSKHSLTSGRRYFRLEWDVAREEQKKAHEDCPFILPVAVDGVNEDHLPVFNGIQWVRAPEGRPSSAFIEKLKVVVRDYRQALERGRA